MFAKVSFSIYSFTIVYALFGVLSPSYLTSFGSSLHTIGGNLRSTRAENPTNYQPHASDVVALKEGADLDLSCPIEVTNEDMIISWTCDNEPANIRSSRIHVTDAGKLRIRSAKIGDSCNYRCEAADGFGTISVIIKVIIVDKKLVHQLSQTSIVSHSDDLKRDDDDDDDATSPSAQNTTLDVQIEPSMVRIDKNRPFSLECRVKHPINLRNKTIAMPQIIWLKKFTGDKPNSLGEAFEKNLVSIDDVYYHSLNWPRSITQSNKSSTTNSALLIRQSDRFHSGSYICFAGYPPYTMSSRLTSDDSAGVSGDPSRPHYRMATAEVIVDENQEGESSFNIHGSATGADSQLVDRRQRYLLVNVVSSNTWMRNLTIILIIFCVLLYSLKTFYIKYRTRRTSTASCSQRPMAATSD